MAEILSIWRKTLYNQLIIPQHEWVETNGIHLDLRVFPLGIFVKSLSFFLNTIIEA